MNILLVVLNIFNDRFGLPPVLNLQLDNCWRENKNKFVFTLLSLLVEWSVFDKVSQRFVIRDDVTRGSMEISQLVLKAETN
jgi:hypothetical protein